MGATHHHDHSAMGKRGQLRRRELGLGVVELARRMGVGRWRVYSLECYGAGSIHVVEQWARVLEMHPADLAFEPRVPALREVG